MPRKVRAMGALRPEAPPEQRPKAPAPRPGRKAKYDWYSIKTAFIEGLKDPKNPEERLFLNLKDLADHMGVPAQRLRERSADERWYEQREQYQLRMAKARQTKRILELSRESVDFDSKSLNVAKLGMAMVTTRVSEIARDVQVKARMREEALKLQAAGFPIDEEDLMTAIDARELSTLATAATQWQVVGQKALGTDIQRMEIQQEIQQNIEVDVEVASISAELGRDDPERLASFLQAAKRAGLLQSVLEESGTSEQLAAVAGPEQSSPPTITSSEEIIDAELVD